MAKGRRQIVSGGAALTEGSQYDFAKVIRAHEILVNWMTARYGKERSSVLVDGNEHPWPDPGRDRLREAWKGLRAHYDVLHHGFTHRIGPVAADARLLGSTWCVYHPNDDALRTPAGAPIHALDADPRILLCGTGAGGEKRPSLDARITADLGLRLVGELSQLRLVLEKGETRKDGDRLYQNCTIRFPHAAYGAGRGWIRVRCALPNGAEVPAADRSTLQ